MILTQMDGVTTSIASTHQGPSGCVNKHFTKWLRSHRSIFNWACFNAFQLKDHPERGVSHIFFVAIKPCAQPLTGKKKKKHSTKNPFYITQVILFTCELFLQTHPGAMVMLSKQDESDAAVKGGERPNLVPTDMFVRCGDDWHSQ
jgi:hypothetical protein